MGLPVVHLDREYWLPGWTEPPREAWEARVRTLCAADAWIMDGNFGSSVPIRLERAQAVVLLDFPNWRCVLGVLRRRLGSVARRRPELPEGVNDRLTLDFLLWIWRFPRRDLPRLEARLGSTAVPVHRLRSRREIRRFLEDLPLSVSR